MGNIAYIGLLSGLILVLICLLTPLAKGAIVGYQLVAVLTAGAIIGYAFRNKMNQSFAVSIWGMLYALVATRYAIFVDERLPALFTVVLVAVTIISFLLSSAFFSLKIKKILLHAIAIMGFFVLFFVIPMVLLLTLRAAYL